MDFFEQPSWEDPAAQHARISNEHADLRLFDQDLNHTDQQSNGDNMPNNQLNMSLNHILQSQEYIPGNDMSGQNQMNDTRHSMQHNMQHGMHNEMPNEMNRHDMNHDMNQREFNQHDLNQHGRQMSRHLSSDMSADMSSISELSHWPMSELPASRERQLSQGEPDKMRAELRAELRVPDVPNELYFSPALSYHGTPLMSPHALVPQDKMYFSTRIRTTSSKASKPSPSSSRWRSSSVPDVEDLNDFALGDPMMMDSLSPTNAKSPNNTTPPHTSANKTSPAAVAASKAVSKSSAGKFPGKSTTGSTTPTATSPSDVEDKLKAAIAATTQAHGPSRSAVSSVCHSRRNSSTSLRTQTSRTASPRIRPKLASNSVELAPRPISPDIYDAFLRSNYQHLVDGTHQHLGLAGADRMSSDLKAKKTVHRIAEKERRNRMNLAIADLNAVLDPLDEKNSTITSKAATVERATLYISQLQARVAELEQRLS